MATFTLSADTNHHKYCFGEQGSLSMAVYKITNKINNKIYIGQSTGALSKRWRNHCNNSGTFVSAIKASIKKYGLENFTFEVVQVAKDIEELNKLETFYIDVYKSLAPDGYNLHSGGNNHKVSEISRQRMSASACRRFGVEKGQRQIKREMSPEERESRRLASIEKMRQTKKGMVSTFAGKSHSEETKEKLSLIKTGKTVPNNYKAIISENGTRYESVKKAVEEIGCNRATLMKHLKGRLMTVYKVKYTYA